ncbi:DUF2497 domain-containing protein [Brevundimonas sp.]|uniref:DUF2497 domain-containing protein n=2 Tax=Brevundimonas sp. TaxID=1871086 RepID=UPI0040344729
MSDQSQEPTMEEILASIRRIISEDDQPAETATPAAPEPEVAAAPEPAPFPTAEPVVAEAEDDVLDLTEAYEAPAVETIGDLDVLTPEEPVAASAPEPEPEPAPAPVAATPDYDALVGESAAASAASAFAGLHALKKPAAPAPAPASDLNFVSGSTVEGMVAEMLRPMLKSWLDANLPGIVEDAVRKEVERIARDAG